MTTVTLVKWGNSMGFRVPKQQLEQAQASVGQQFQLACTQQGGFTLTPVESSRSGWLQAFSADNTPQDTAFDIRNDFDDEEWTW